MPRYDPQRLEKKWQDYWEQNRTFETPAFPAGEKLYVLDMFPYPSGQGLHVGHPEGYTATDITCRYARMRGKTVLHPMGWDAFGLPAEQYAIKTGTHPRETTYRNIDTFRRQLKMLGFSYDWSRELATTDPDYFRWTQWIFLQIFDTWYDAECQWTDKAGRKHTGKGRPIAELPIPGDVQGAGASAVRRYQDKHRLAYQTEAPVNWCPALGTVLANEEVIDGKSERGSHPVVRIPLRQWMLRITAYADRLQDDLESVNWPESIKLLQRNWIGKSEGAEVDFFIGAPVHSDGARALRLPDSSASPAKSNSGTVGAHRISAVIDLPVTVHDLSLAMGWQPSEVLRILAKKGLLVSLPSIIDESTAREVAVECGIDLRVRHEQADERIVAFNSWKAARAKSGFPRDPGDDVLRIYTTRPDTLFGATYMVLAPEHPYVDRLTTLEQKTAVAAYRQQASTKSDLDRTDLAKEKSGVFTGSYATNPVNGKLVPIWIADYVLISYGTGAIMAVPAHDLRDWEFAVKFNLPIIPVVTPPPGYEPGKEERQLQRAIAGGLECPFAGEGTAIASGPYSGLSTLAFKKKITDELATQGLGRGAVNYRLRDWLFSRQHFWGEPFPIWHELGDDGQPTGLMRTDAESELPVTLPEMRHFKPHGRPEPPLAEAPQEWLFTTAPDGTKLARETNTMPQWAGSCWYYLRFIDPKNSTAFIGPAKEKAWMPVDLYIGGAEHAVLHLLYSRFWHKVLFDRGHVSGDEPFQRLVNQGMILGEAELTGYQLAPSEKSEITPVENWTGAKPEITWVSARNVRDDVDIATGFPVQAVKLSADQVTKKGNDFILTGNPVVVVESRAFKMSKARGNVINPDTVVDEYGADSLRLYEMFMGPLEATKPWSMSGVEGVSRFLARVWRMLSDEGADEIRLNPAVQDVPPTPEQTRLLHKTIQAVTNDIENLSFNTAISRMMEFVNAVSGQEPRPRAILEPFILLLAPFAPHLAEESWELLGHKKSLTYEPWPLHDPALLVESEVEIAVQINGKVRGKIRIPADAGEEAVRNLAAAESRVAEQLAGKQIVKVVYVPGRLFSFVVK